MDFFTGKEIEVPEDVQKLLQFNEKVLLSAETARSASLIAPETIFISSQRVIVKRPTTLGLRKNIEDYRYTDIANVKLKKGIIRSGIILKMRFLSDNVEVDNFPKEIGERIFRLVQDGVEGRLAAAQPGNPVVKTPPNAPNTPNVPSASQQEIIEKIKELAKLKDQGILTDTEFQNKKSELLSRL